MPSCSSAPIFLPCHRRTSAQRSDLLARRGEVLVLGPAEDGGYYLIGLTQSRPELFERHPLGHAAGAAAHLRSRRSAWDPCGNDAPLVRRRFTLRPPASMAHAPSSREDAARYTRAWLAAAPPAVRARVDGETMMRGVHVARTIESPRSRGCVLLGAGLAVASALVLLAGPLGYRLGILPLRFALLTFLRGGAMARLPQRLCR